MKRVRRGKLKDLNAEMLAEVFSFLPSEDLAEVMPVSKHWERSAIEGSGLCQRVTVARKWDMGGGVGKGHNFMCKVLAAAKEVEFKNSFFGENEHIESLVGVLGSNLRFLEIPDDGVSSAFLPILISQCPHLKTLLLDGEPKGNGPIDIRHPQLETLTMYCQKLRALTIDCPNLTHLSTIDAFGYLGSDEMMPPLLSFTCPSLTDLSLSPLHSTVAVWEFLAAHAPNIKRLQVCCSLMNPFTTLTGFKALHTLRVKGELRGIPPHFDFGQWPLLEGMLLKGKLFPTDLQVRHAHLKELRIEDSVRPISLVLDCPSLKKLWVYDVHLANNLDSHCPRLRSLRQGRGDYGKPWREVPGSLEFVHETVEELECRNFFLPMKRIACPKLTKLVLGWEVYNVPQLVFPIVECLSLLRLEVYGYAHLVSNLPLILAVLPDLVSLRIGELNGWKDVVLEHSCIKDLVLQDSKARSLVLIMPSLVHVDIGETKLDVMKVASMEKTITVDFSQSRMRLDKRRRVFRGGGTMTLDLSDAM